LGRAYSIVGQMDGRERQHRSRVGSAAALHHFARAQVLFPEGRLSGDRRRCCCRIHDHGWLADNRTGAQAGAVADTAPASAKSVIRPPSMVVNPCNTPSTILKVALWRQHLGARRSGARQRPEASTLDRCCRSRPFHRGRPNE